MKMAALLVEDGLMNCVISGGEPLLRNRLAGQLIDYLHDYGVYVVLNCSGVLFRGNRQLTDFLSEMPDLFVFSLDSVDESRHDASRRMPGLFDAVHRSIAEILAMNQPRPAVGVRFVMTRYNFNEIPTLIQMLSAWGVDCLKITNIENDSSLSYSLSDIQTRLLWDEVIPSAVRELSTCAFQREELREDALVKMSGFMSGMDGASLSRNLFSKHQGAYFECPLGAEFVLVGGDGSIYPCCEAEHQGFPVLGKAGITSVEDIHRNLSRLRFDRLDYCSRCTAERNIQINFTDRCMNVNDRCGLKNLPEKNKNNPV